jgi:hypothetical protein
MKNFFRAVLLLVYLSAAPGVYACDVCGCSSVSQSLGLLPQFSGHFAGIQYLYMSAVSNHPALLSGEPVEHSAQYFNTMQIWGRYQLGRRLQLYAFVPYVYNRYKDGSSRNTAGIGDISVALNTVLLQSEQHGRKQLLLAGGGIKIPAGSYSGSNAADRSVLPNMQTGTGSTDILLNGNYTFIKRRGGLNFDAAAVLTTANGNGYKFGNRFALTALGFYQLDYKHFRLAPQAGFRQEYTLHDYDNYHRKWLNEQSGGYIGYLSGGMQAYYSKWGLKLMLHVPILQYYASGIVQVRPRVEGGIFFLF